MASRGLSSGQPTQEQLGRLVRTGGSRRRYVDPQTGESFSRRQAEKAQLQFGARPKPAPSGRMSYYNALIREKAAETGRSKGDVRRDPATKQAIKDLNTKNKEPGGRKARALEYFGRREPGATYRVGETPKGRKKR